MGLFDREYMNRPEYFQGTDGMPMIWKLIGANVIIYLLVTLTTPAAQIIGGMHYYQASEIFTALALSGSGMHDFKIYQLLSAAFLHQEFWHMLLNMWGLYLFGGLIAPYMSGRKILILYIIGGISGNLLFLLFNWSSNFQLCGASGAVYAITIAAAMLEPNRRFVMIFLPFWPLKTSTMVVCFTVIELFQQLGGIDGRVAHLAHLGGFIGGYIFIKYLAHVRVSWDPLRFLGVAAGGGSRVRTPRDGSSYRADEYRRDNWTAASGDFSSGQNVSQRELDFLLDKISTLGVNGLSEEELATLRRAREQMKRPGR